MKEWTPKTFKTQNTKGFVCSISARVWERSLQGAEGLRGAAPERAAGPGGAVPRDAGSLGDGAPQGYSGDPGGRAPCVA